MARRPPSGWALAHNKQPVRGASIRDIKRRRSRRRQRETLRLLVRYGGYQPKDQRHEP